MGRRVRPAPPRPSRLPEGGGPGAVAGVSGASGLDVFHAERAERRKGAKKGKEGPRRPGYQAQGPGDPAHRGLGRHHGMSTQGGGVIASRLAPTSTLRRAWQNFCRNELARYERPRRLGGRQDREKSQARPRAIRPLRHETRITKPPHKSATGFPSPVWRASQGVLSLVPFFSRKRKELARDQRAKPGPHRQPATTENHTTAGGRDRLYTPTPRVGLKPDLRPYQRPYQRSTRSPGDAGQSRDA